MDGLATTRGRGEQWPEVLRASGSQLWRRRPTMPVVWPLVLTSNGSTSSGDGRQGLGGG